MNALASDQHPHHAPPTPLQQAKRKLLFSLALFAGLLAFGTVGYYIVDRVDSNTEEARSVIESFYFTLVVLTTVGMDGPVSALERYFSIILMLVGIFLAAAAASNLVAFAIDGELNKHFGRRRLDKQIASLDGHFIVVGFGRMGRSLCEQMRSKGEPYVLIERDPDKAEEAVAAGHLCIAGDATDESLLLRAGMEHAAGLATCLPDDPANVFVTLTARGIRPHMEIAARAEDPATEPKLLKAGANRVICPPVVGATRLREMLIKPVVQDLIPDTSAEADAVDVCVFRVDKLPKLAGLTLGQADIPGKCGMLVTAVEREGEMTFDPPRDYALTDTDRLYVMGPDGGSNQLIAAFGAEPRQKQRPRARY